MSGRRVHVLTLGCDKNLVDSEALLGRFAGAGFTAVADAEAADVWVLNTCGFIDAARRDSADTLGQLAAHKGQRTLVVCGCWSQEHAAAIAADYPAVDVVAGVGQFDRVVAACLGRAPASGPDLAAFPLADGPLVDTPLAANYTGLIDRPLLTPGHVAFVKIGEGCNCACTFCRIPLIRGKLRSRPTAEILREVQGLAARGVSEIQLVSQNTSDYGRDTGEALLDLVRALDGVDGLRVIRLLYLYQGLVTPDDLLRLLELPRVAPYLEIPIQHASPRILKAMRRPGGERNSAAFFARLRREHPDLVLRSTALLGFPGEQEEDVELLADFLAEVEFDHLGTYRYSPEPGTPAFDLPDRVPDEVILDREALILDLQSEISQERQNGRLGRQWDVVVDRVVGPQDEEFEEIRGVLDSLADGEWVAGREPGPPSGVRDGAVPVAVGRSRHFGYDLDGVVLLPAAGLQPGRWIRTTFLGATPYDIWAEPDAG